MVERENQERLASIVLIALLAVLTILVATSRPFLLTADIRFENLLVSVRTPFLLSVFGWITLLGNPLVVVAVAGLVTLYLLLTRSRKSYEVGFAATLIGAVISAYWMKAIVERARPSGLIPSAIETSFSFPSGHATVAVALYGFIAFLLCNLFPKKTKIIAAIAAIVVLAIGFSRLYLGVHYPSDVMAGFCLGGLWLLLGIEISHRFHRKV